MSSEDDFVALFREEAAGRLDVIDELLLELEAGRGGQEAVDTLFREFHTIKGAAGLVGLDDAYALAHAVEDLLEPIRRDRAPSAGVADALLRAAGALRAQVGGDSAAPSPELLEDLIRLRAELEAGDGQAAPAAIPARTGAAGEAPAAEDANAPRAIRVRAERLDRVLDLVGETMLHRRRLEHALGERLLAARGLADELDQGDRLFEELQAATLTLRTVPLRSITGPLPRAVRDVAVAEGKEARLEVAGADTELDRVILERLSDPLVHLLRNAVHHGIESPEERAAAGKPRQGMIELRAEQRGPLVEVLVTDDGRGVTEETLAEAAQGVALADVLSRPGFSTADEITGVAGRGVGLDAVKRQVESLGGRLEVHSRPRAGTQIALLLPLTLALLDVLLVERDGQPFALPLASVLETARVDASLELAGRRSLELRGEPVPLADLADVVAADARALPGRPPAVVIASGAGRIALVCDRVLGEQEIIVRTLGPLLSKVPNYLGAAVLGDGRVALLLDPAAVDPLPRGHGGRVKPSQGTLPGADHSDPTVLVVEDSLTVRALQRSILEGAGYRVEVAGDGIEAWDQLRRNSAIGLVVTDVDMPRMDGFALLEAIRGDPERATLPVVIVTARTGGEDRRRGLHAGADAYVEKRSFNQRALLATVNQLLGR